MITHTMSALTTPRMAIAGFVCAIPSLFVPLLGVVAIVLSAIGLIQARDTGAPKGLAIAGLLLGTASIATGLLVAAILFGGGGS